MSEYTPITGELRNYEALLHDEGSAALARIGEFCDAIDAIHAQLERENAALKAELDRVPGEQEEHEHTRGESITDELREVAAKTECANGRCEKLYRGDLERIADRIDAEHERQLGVLYRDMSDAEWVRLPKDADGVPIRVGDTVEYVDDTLAPRNVTSINLAGDGWWVYINGLGRRPDRYRHATPDTWERIIADVLQRGHDDYPLNVDTEPYVARCKALCERTKEAGE